MAFSTDNSQREAQFNSLVSENRQLICKVCYMYATDVDYFNDLYQETLANIWSAMDSFRGEARISTWLYRIAINSCVTFFRRHHRHDSLNTPDPMEKALIMMWLDENSYDEISEVTGLARNTVATRLRRIKQKLIDRSQQ
ncbi:MAG: sigma-70 family RNA polymerase sigma factor [Prevotella sp.]|nr:sigma-70 family RNA polymerase sigma factor [Prevotella sp.]